MANSAEPGCAAFLGHFPSNHGIRLKEETKL